MLYEDRGRIHGVWTSPTEYNGNGGRVQSFGRDSRRRWRSSDAVEINEWKKFQNIDAQSGKKQNVQIHQTTISQARDIKGEEIEE